MNAQVPTRGAAAEADAIARIGALVVARTGHAFYEGKETRLAEVVRGRVLASDAASAAAYLALLEEGSDRAEAEWRRLESAVTVNETFFFRFGEQFAALRGKIIPDLIRRRAKSRRLRIWSAGCSTGAEAYSLGVVVHDLLGARAADWAVSITGTDIDEDALAVGREGLFGDWALRAVPAEERARLFEAEGPRWRIRMPFRGMVRFERLNLLDLIGPGAPLGHSDYDLILCRNVLIYFAPAEAGAVARALSERLAECGVLLLGHAESGPAAEAGLALHMLGGVGVHLRADDLRLARAAPARAVPPPEPQSATTPPPLRRRTAVRRARAAPEPQPVPDEEAAAAMRALLDGGDAAGALALGAAAIERQPTDPALHFLLGLGALAEADGAGAEQAFARALYLQDDFAMAHYMLGVACAGRGDAAGASRAYRAAIRSLKGLDADAPVPEGQGMRAGDLLASLEARLERGAESG